MDRSILPCPSMTQQGLQGPSVCLAGKWNVDVVNKNLQCHVDVCSERFVLLSTQANLQVLGWGIG